MKVISAKLQAMQGVYVLALFNIVQRLPPDLAIVMVASRASAMGQKIHAAFKHDCAATEPDQCELLLSPPPENAHVPAVYCVAVTRERAATLLTDLELMGQLKQPMPPGGVPIFWFDETDHSFTILALMNEATSAAPTPLKMQMDANFTPYLVPLTVMMNAYLGGQPDPARCALVIASPGARRDFGRVEADASPEQQALIHKTMLDQHIIAYVPIPLVIDLLAPLEMGGIATPVEDLKGRPPEGFMHLLWIQPVAPNEMNDFIYCAWLGPNAEMKSRDDVTPSPVPVEEPPAAEQVAGVVDRPVVAGRKPMITYPSKGGSA